VSVILEASREGIKKLNVLRVEKCEDGDRPESGTMSIYFNMRIGMIRD
jgi:hypothetical protein